MKAINLKLIVLLVLSVIITGCRGTKKLLRDVDERKVVEMVNNDKTIEASVDYFDIKPKPNRTYHWYWKDLIQQNVGGYNGALLHGNYVVYDVNKNLIEKANFRKGVPKKKYLYWHPNGKVFMSEKYKRGRLNGKYFIYDQRGVIVEKGKHKKGVKQGNIVFYLEGEKSYAQRYRKGDVDLEKIEEQELKVQEKSIKKMEKKAGRTEKDAQNKSENRKKSKPIEKQDKKDKKKNKNE